MKRVLITGATGFLGGAAAHELRRAGWEVITTGRNSDAGERLRRDGFRFERCELAEEGEPLRILAKGCEAVVHCAALSSPWGRKKAFHSCNVDATGYVLAACRHSGARLIHISTPSVSFGFAHHRYLREDAPWPEPAANHYIATKRDAERLVRRATEVPSLILRPKALIGPGDTTLIPRILRVARRGVFPLFGDDTTLLDLTWIGDAATAIRLGLEAPTTLFGKVYHISGGQPLPVREALAILFAACGLNVRFRTLPARPTIAVAGMLERLSLLITAGRWEPPITRYTVGSLAYEQSLDISAAKSDLGYVPQKNIREALTECGRRWREQSGYHPS